MAWTIECRSDPACRSIGRDKDSVTQLTHVLNGLNSYVKENPTKINEFICENPKKIKNIEFYVNDLISKAYASAISEGTITDEVLCPDILGIKNDSAVAVETASIACTNSLYSCCISY